MLREVVVGVVTAISISIIYYLKDQADSIVLSIPSGAIVAFDSVECPKGWSEFSDAAGRVVLGEGHGKGLTNRAYRETGGEERLRAEHLPVHSHQLSVYHGDDSTGGAAALQGGDADKNKITHNSYRTTEYGAKANDEAMMPYIVLSFCKKE